MQNRNVLAMRLLVAATLTLAMAIPWAALAQSSGDPDAERSQMPIKIGDVTIIKGNITHRSGVVLDSKGTAYLLSILSNGDSNLLRISRKGAVQDLIMYRGWPYVLDRRGRLYAFDASWKTDFRNKLPYIAMRSLRTIPLAVGAGVGVYGLAMLDQTFMGVISIEAFRPSQAFWSGFMGYYGLDLAYTVFLKSHRAIGWGGNFFTTLVAKGVAEVKPDQNYDDYQVILRRGRSRVENRFLSHLAPAYAGQSSCVEYLTKMNMR